MVWHWRSLVFRVLKSLIARKFPDVKWITTKQLEQWLADSSKPQPIVLDARNQAEYAVSHLNNAVWIDPHHPNLEAMGDKPPPRANAPVATDIPIVVYCSVGYRSAAVAHKLEQAGFSQAYNLEGSIFQWANEGRQLYQNHHPTSLVHPYNPRWGRLLKSQHRADVSRQVT